MSDANNTWKKKTDSDRTVEFREIADQICSIAAGYSLKVVGYHSPDLPLFNSLPIQKQSEVLHQLKVFRQTMQAAEATGDRLDNSERSLWHALLTLGLIPPSEMFTRIKSEDVIEVYDLQGIQIWRNFNFLRICSYTLEEMHALEWPERYDRDPGKTSECLAKVGELLSGKTSDIFFADVSAHILEETQSSERYVLEAKHSYIGRMKNHQGQIAAWFATSDVKLLGRSLSLIKKPQLSIVPPQPRPPSQPPIDIQP